MPLTKSARHELLASRGEGEASKFALASGAPYPASPKKLSGSSVPERPWWTAGVSPRRVSAKSTEVVLSAISNLSSHAKPTT